MKRIWLLLAWFTPVAHLCGQVPDTVSLDFCYRQAENNFPLSKQVGLLGKSSELKVKNLNKNYLPTLNLNGSASYQSDVTEVSIPVLAGNIEISMPTLSKDWYKMTLDVNQSIYDGNITHYEKKLETYNLQSDQMAVQVELYQLKDRINQVYFNIILSLKTEEVLKNSKASLEARLKEVESAVRNGTMMASSQDAIRVEIIRIDQDLGTLYHDRSASFSMLSELTSTEIPETSQLVLPDVKVSSLTFEDQRLEYQLFDVQQDRNGLLKNMVTTKWNPKFYAYGQAGYGRPGLNMLSNDFTPWWFVGAKITWNFFNWNSNRNEKKIYDIQADIIRSQKETFDKNLRVEADRGIAEILKLTDLLRQDQDIVDLRAQITRTASSQLTNGIITSSEYIARLNEEIQARLNMELHRIQLVRARLSYLYTLGKL
ncbi:MAG TPA: TolC family protein [Bacteroidales bacterium]|nr:TolC family protein [Bacteroidales bacterium]